jgi:methylenetetrahydrofolate dehydrogenase (NADP+) / methenyltetrahydrofolate cyclohydrolase
MKLLDGSNYSKELDINYQNRVNNFKSNNINPCLAVILVGDSIQSKIYINMKRKRCEKIGIKFVLINLKFEVYDEDIINEIKKLNNDVNINGILVQLPLPKHIDTDLIIKEINPKKDVDGFHYNNFGKLSLNLMTNHFTPCTPLGCIRLLERYNIDLLGKDIVVIGKSNIVGLPLSLLLMHREATVTVCHIHTKNLKEKTQKADIICVGCGVPNMITKEYIKPGVILIDIGINKIEIDGKMKIVGDVDMNDCSETASYISPVPGGIGPMTISMLIENLLNSCEY